MSLNKANSGFTMVELLVVMVLIALLGGVVVPGIYQWIDSRTFAAQKKAIAREIAALPALAQFSHQRITVDSVGKLSDDIRGDITITTPIQILSNGYCLGGELAWIISEIEYRIIASPPFCKVTLIPR